MCAVAVTVMLGSGCSTTYKPTQRVTAMSNEMSEKQAVEVLYRLMLPRNHGGQPTRHFVVGHVGLGICKAYEFSLDDQKGSDFTVTNKEISFNAAKAGKLLSSTTQGNVTSATGMTVTRRYERVAYREHLRFDQIGSISIREPGLLSTTCGRQEGQLEVYISESMKRWYSVLIPTPEKERFIAAWLRLRPDIKIKE
jgi:hypothetical protein